MNRLDTRPETAMLCVAIHPNMITGGPVGKGYRFTVVCVLIELGVLKYSSAQSGLEMNVVPTLCNTLRQEE